MTTNNDVNGNGLKLDKDGFVEFCKRFHSPLNLEAAILTLFGSSFFTGGDLKFGFLSLLEILFGKAKVKARLLRWTTKKLDDATKANDDRRGVITVNSDCFFTQFITQVYGKAFIIRYFKNHRVPSATSKKKSA